MTTHDARAAIAAGLAAGVADYEATYRHLRGDLGELTLPGHRPIVFTFGKPRTAWTRLTRPPIHYDGLYEPATTYVLSRIVADAKPARAFDLGATGGYFSLVMASHRDVATAVDAFDLTPVMARRFEASLAANPALADRSLTFHMMGVSDRTLGSREVWLHKSRLFETEPRPEDYRESLFRRMKYRLSGERHKEGLSRFMLPVESLDDFCEARGIEPDLVKMDVDGYEAKVIPGAMRLLARRRPWIVMEIHRRKFLAPHGATRESVVKPLLEMGYRALLVVGRKELGRVAWIPVELGSLDRLETRSTDLLVLY
ncbi:MAG TPA: FkbM family methyltransferase [Hyphomicrobiales bacterium]|nr:FkbM family methyltransferase [Hyphomicrobiales bacterium]